ncbi:hypothetical protein BV898_11731 [Hypsibius exemplaris]|uniref:Uncharacterized protein n=1 Tax=Hypsibius exemplaris TaxID=2072580 RepID=A0A1W0WFS9_HYPEX|nr:hypothetical protein BV898_11731 [Hypsibius exemplaris]
MSKEALLGELENDQQTDLNLEQSFWNESFTPRGCSDVGAAAANNPFAVLAGQSLYDVVTENLHEQIRELRDVNARLSNTVCEKEHEIRQLLQRSVSSVSDSSDKDAAATGGKITELARAKRDLTAKYEAEHSRVQKLQAEKAELAAKLAETQQKVANLFREHGRLDELTAKKSSGKIPERRSTGEELDAAALHHRLQVAIEKASVATQENQCLKQQLQRATKALEREVGPNVEISDIIKNDSSTYRGRDQQIQLLRAKLEITKKQLDAFHLFDDCTSETKSNKRTSTSSVKIFSKPEQNEYNARHRDQLTQEDQKRRSDFKALTEEYKQLQYSHFDLKSKMTAVKARIDYLSKENLRLSQFNRHLVETCQKDAELIKYFQTTITELRGAFSKTSIPTVSGVGILTDTTQRPARSSLSDSSNSRSSTDRTILRKISNMESQIKDLKNVHSLTFEQWELSAGSGGDGGLGRRSSGPSSRSSTARSSAAERALVTRNNSTPASSRARQLPLLKDPGDSLDDE